MPNRDAQALQELEARPLDVPAGLDLSWLGVSGYRLTYEGASLFIDPYVSRVPLRCLLLRRRALPDPALVDRYLTAPPGEVEPRRAYELGPFVVRFVPSRPSTSSSPGSPVARSRRATGSASCPGSTRASSSRPTTTTSSRRSAGRSGLRGR